LFFFVFLFCALFLLPGNCTCVLPPDDALGDGDGDGAYALPSGDSACILPLGDSLGDSACILLPGYTPGDVNGAYALPTGDVTYVLFSAH
jgi:hypothetical protein